MPGAPRPLIHHVERIVWMRRTLIGILLCGVQTHCRQPVIKSGNEFTWLSVTGTFMILNWAWPEVCTHNDPALPRQCGVRRM